MDAIQKWSRIKKDFKGSDLLLGNGFSINIDSKFSYSSLFKSFLEFVDKDFKNIINKFGTNNFEFIVEQLNSAQRVNKLFGIDSPQVGQAADIIKDGLIKAVNKNHPRKDNISWDHIDKIATEMIMQFDDIYTLNYDIYLYHILLRMNELINSGGQYTGKSFADGFWKGINSRYNEFPGFQSYPYRMVYYLHGALFIFKKRYSDRKLVRGNNSSEILDLITESIHNGEIPLFVSEGTSSEKRDLISRSTYLNYCMMQLRSSSSNFVIYGASLTSQDKHIADAINSSFHRDRKIAYAMYTNNKETGELKREIKRIKSVLSNHDIIFFDSNGLFKN